MEGRGVQYLDQKGEENRMVDGEGHGDGDAEGEGKVTLVKLPAESAQITNCPNVVASLAC